MSSTGATPPTSMRSPIPKRSRSFATIRSWASDHEQAAALASATAGLWSLRRSCRLRSRDGDVASRAAPGVAGLDGKLDAVVPGGDVGNRHAEGASAGTVRAPRIVPLERHGMVRPGESHDARDTVQEPVIEWRESERDTRGMLRAGWRVRFPVERDRVTGRDAEAANGPGCGIRERWKLRR